MYKHLNNTYRLGVKELFSFRHDIVMVILVIYTFTYAVYVPSQSALMELRNASIGIVDEDRSQFSRRISDAMLQPYFKPAVQINYDDIDSVMDSGKFTFVVNIPPNFEADILAKQLPTVQVNVDATAMAQAGNGAIYIQNIISQEIKNYMLDEVSPINEPVNVAIRTKFNPNLNSTWFLGVMQIINMTTLLAVILTGAALIREREQGTIEHLLVMPLTVVEIMTAKIWANGLVIVIAATLSLLIVVQQLLNVPILGSIPLFILGTIIYLFSVTALGILLATIARSMPQFGLLAFPIFMIMNLLSGSSTPLESMPTWLQISMQFVPSTHFVNFAQAILYRGADFDIVWKDFAAIFVIGIVYFFVALIRFRKTITKMQA